MPLSRYSSEKSDWLNSLSNTSISLGKIFIYRSWSLRSLGRSRNCSNTVLICRASGDKWLRSHRTAVGNLRNKNPRTVAHTFRQDIIRQRFADHASPTVFGSELTPSTYLHDVAIEKKGEQINLAIGNRRHMWSAVGRGFQCAS